MDKIKLTEASGKLRFIQIMTSAYVLGNPVTGSDAASLPLLGLDKGGQVWQYEWDEEYWYPLSMEIKK